MSNQANEKPARVFSLADPVVVSRRGVVRKTLDQINNGTWESDDERLSFLREAFGSLGDNPYILEPVSFVVGKNLFLGDNVFINSNVTFIDAAPIHIGDHAMIAPGCVLTTVDHSRSPKERRGFNCTATPITIGRDVWLGANFTIFPGVTIGNNVIIGANSVVNRDIPANSIVVGASARIIKEIPDDTPEAAKRDE